MVTIFLTYDRLFLQLLLCRNRGDDMEVVGERLRSLREYAGKTQGEVSKLLGTTQQIYSRYETGKNELPLHHLVNLANFYNVSTDYLLGRISYQRLPSDFTKPLIQNITIGEFVFRVSSFSNSSKRQLIEYMNFLTYLENFVRKKARGDDGTKSAKQTELIPRDIR